ncbi:electron transfer flavoprotein subunit alpha [Thermoanaerobaculum aquaticum]|uniref:Electron transfer flavoprotein subunit alpha n=1 Tax=Thermoanaerobaculum aquaticum TaxID=1312852 RepID=A0A062XZ39_9BACT|nr:electron transfer flavoprotein subunit alpha/FixB family protein [Thermoanaerobaculum aquaticum]KDA54714.1 electron transfer flavoprotein subunit alpha [Thermoanaerobaculum aquaticum]
MAGILVFVEQRDGQIRKASLEALSEAKRLAQAKGMPVSAVLLGSGVSQLAAGLGEWGAEKVFVADQPELAQYSPQAYAQAVAQAVAQAQPQAVFLGATALGRDLSGRLAAKLKVGCLPDVTALKWDGDTLQAVRPVYSGKALATVDGGHAVPVVVTTRPNVFAAQKSPTTAEVVSLPAVAVSGGYRVKEVVTSQGGELDVAEADIIVSGGRGLRGPENFALIRELAKVLGAAVGASRAAVDAGWIDHAHQVGQTGKVVSPTLYIACGISGAIQHLAGMSSSKVIVAINKDPEAPIFKVADYGVVGDLFQVIPALTEEIRKLKA